mgnify:FL=1
MENANGVDMSEAIKPVNKLGQDGVAGIANRRQQRQAKRDEERRLREQAFLARQKVTRAEVQQLINVVVDLSREVSIYKGFVRNIFFVLDHKGVITLKEMDEVAKTKVQELKDYHELAGDNELP